MWSIAAVSRRICCRCGTSFCISQAGKHTRKEECNYHYGKVMENRGEKGIKWRTVFTRHILYINTARQISGDTNTPHVKDFLACPLQYWLHHHLNLNHSSCSGKNWIETFERFFFFFSPLQTALQPSGYYEIFRKLRCPQPFECT